MSFYVPVESSDQQPNARIVSYLVLLCLKGVKGSGWLWGVFHSMEHLGGDAALSLLFPWAQVLTISAKSGRLDPTQCWEVQVFTNQESPDLWLPAQLADARGMGFMSQPSAVSWRIVWPNLNQSELQSPPQNLNREVHRIPELKTLWVNVYR